MTLTDLPLEQPRTNLPRQGVELVWPYDITSHGFTAYVVEPLDYQPAGHAALFLEIITAALAPMGVGGQVVAARRGLKSFDLMTFPEAFITPETLISALDAIKTLNRAPLYHVGLRARYDDGHLFTVAEAIALVGELKTLLEPAVDDLDPLENWLGTRDSDERYNLACVFTLDVHERLRLCVHPKNTPSPDEVRSLPADTVTATEFLSVVTLKPANVGFRNIHLQPVICSDLLDLRTTTGSPGPLVTLSDPEGRLVDPPDSIDIVSAVTCTRQTPGLEDGGGGRGLSWHWLFRSTFEASLNGTSLRRHLNALFVLANFRRGPPHPSDGRRPDQGLSGCFAPTPPYRPEADGTVAWSFGRVGQEDRSWTLAPGPDFQDDGQLLTIAPTLSETPATAQLMRFSLTNLIRYQGGNGRSGPSAIEVLQWSPLSRDNVTLEEIANG